ncbi:MAG: ABC transporter substrate-binding protein [Bacilli bacterium]|nr:ABC transporter substrate-binding protein [Bacilli bacterium]
MKRTNILLPLALLAFSLAACQSSSSKKIAIIQLGTHTSLNEINEAIQKKIKDANKGYEIVYRNAEFSLDQAAQIVSSLKDNVDLAIAIATPIAQACYNGFSEKTPIVFAAVSDPVGAGLIKNLEAPESNITGTSDAIQVASILDKARLVDPDLDQLGFIYNPAEANSVSNKAKVEEYCTNYGIQLNAVTISAVGEMSEIASSLINRVDAVFVSDDNTVASAMSVLGSICRDAGKPCYVGADSMVKDGGMMCIGINYTILGEKTGEMALDILGGKKVSEVPVKIFNDNLNLYLNKTYVEEADIEIPAEILNDPMLVEIEEENA